MLSHYNAKQRSAVATPHAVRDTCYKEGAIIFSIRQQLRTASPQGITNNFKTWRLLTVQRMRDNQLIVHCALVILTGCGFALALFKKRDKAVILLSQVHRSSRNTFLRRLVEPYISRNRSSFFKASFEPVQMESFFSGNRLLVLKPPLPNGERGVLFVMFSEMLDLLYSSMEMERLLRDYTLVFEPSYPGYCNARTLQYTRFRDEIFILSPVPEDFAFLRRLRSNLVPVDLAPCDWVDPRVAEPYLKNPKEYDIIMNAMWASLKRHFVLFKMLAAAKRRYKVALIGVPWAGRDRYDIEREARYYGVLHQLEIFESIPYTQVMDVTCRSRISMLLSLKEGGNRAIAESIFCNVPVLLLRQHIGGVAKNIVPQTGVSIEEKDLEWATEHLLRKNIDPRQWGLEHISCSKSSDRLNGILREHAVLQGRPWTEDIAERSNSPEGRYVFDVDARRLRIHNEALKKYRRC